MTGPLKLDERGKLEIPEAEVQRACDDLLAAYRWRVKPQPVTIPCPHCGRPVYIPGAQKGQPDRMIMKAGPRGSDFRGNWWRIVFVELKRRGKKARPDQALYHAALRREGFEVLVIDRIKELAEWMGVKLGPV